MDLTVYGFDPKRISWLKEKCAALSWSLIPSQTDENAMLVVKNDFFDPQKYNDFLKAHKGKRFILPPDVELVVLDKAITLLNKSGGQEHKSIMPPELQTRYSNSVYAKIILLHELTQHVDRDTVRKFKDEVHKIAGSAGSFGYQEMTDLSRRTELVLNEILENPDKKSADEIREILIEYQNSLKLAFQNILHI